MIYTGYQVHWWLCGRVPDLQSGGCRFESQPGLLHTKAHSAFHPYGVGNLWLGRQRQVWLILLADEVQGVQVKLCYPLTMCFIGHFRGGPGLDGTRMSPLQVLLELRVMEVAKGDNWSYKL